MNQAKRFVIRASLVTGSTLATLIGAQSLLALNPPAAIPSNTSSIVIQDQPQSVLNSAPNIAIIRRNGESTTTAVGQPAQSSTASGVLIQPPAPVIVAPAQAIVPAQPSTQSSR